MLQNNCSTSGPKREVRPGSTCQPKLDWDSSSTCDAHLAFLLELVTFLLSLVDGLLVVLGRGIDCEEHERGTTGNDEVVLAAYKGRYGHSFRCSGSRGNTALTGWDDDNVASANLAFLAIDNGLKGSCLSALCVDKLDI